MDRMLNRAFYPMWTEGSLERENTALYLQHLEASYCGKKFPHILGGKELGAGEYYPSIDPNRPTRIVASFPRIDAANARERKCLDKGIARVVLAQERFRKVPYQKRIELCEAFADRLEDQMYSFIALLMLQGKPAGNAFGEFREAPEFVRNNIALAKQLYAMSPLDPIPQFMADANGYHLLPNGPIVSIDPFNFPIAIPSDKISSALLTGNAIIMKASGHVPLAGYLLFLTIEAAFRDVGLENDGVVNFLSGAGKDLALYLVTHPLINAYTFTGSLDAAHEIRRATIGGKPHGGMMQEIAAETSGCNPFVVWNDADLDPAVSYAVASLRNNSGQTCSHLGHLILHEDIEAEFLRRFIQGLEATQYGDVKDMSKPKLNQCGAIISQHSLEGYLQKVNDMRLSEIVDIVYRKSIPTECQGFDFPPMLMRLDPRVKKYPELLHAWRSTELFCMAASYTTVRTLEEAKKICEAGRFKLTGSFFTDDADTARYFIEEVRCAGQWYWNSGCTGALAGMAFGGDALSGSSGSGMGASTLPALARYVTLQNLAFRFPKNWGELEKGAFAHSLRHRTNIVLP